MADRLMTIPGAEVINDVVLNQVLLRLPGEMMPTAPRWPPFSATGPAGSAARYGTASTCCGYRFRTGRQQTMTWNARPMP